MALSGPMVQCSDGGLALAGRLWKSSSKEDTLIKLDSGGNIQWNIVLPSFDPASVGIVQTMDGGYALICSNSLVKLDSSGNMQWYKTYGFYEWAGEIVLQTSDGGFAIGGAKFNSSDNTYYNFLVKADRFGNVQWTKTYPLTAYSSISAILQLSDGSYLLGCTAGFPSDAHLIKTDVNGTAQWQKSFGGSGEESIDSLIQCSDGGYMVASSTTSYGGDPHNIFLIKVNSAGQIAWNKTYGETNKNNFGTSIVQTDDQGFAFVYNAYGLQSHGGIDDLTSWLTKITSTGTVQFAKVIGWINMTGVSGIRQNPDKGYSIAICTNYTAPYQSFGIIKTDSEGNISLAPTITIVPEATVIPEFPSWVFFSIFLLSALLICVLFNRNLPTIMTYKN